MKRLLIAALAALALGWSLRAHAQEPVVICPYNALHTTANCETTPLVSTASESSHLFRGNGSNGVAAPGNVVGIDVANWSQGTNVSVILVDANAVPSAGTLSVCTPSPNNNSACVLKWFSVATANSTAPGTFTRTWAPGPMLHFINGLVALCNTSNSPTTWTASASCTFSAEIE